MGGANDLLSLRFMSPRYRGAVVHISRGPMDDRPSLCTPLFIGNIVHFEYVPGSS